MHQYKYVLYLYNYKEASPLYKLLQKVKYGIGIRTIAHKIYGTKENTSMKGTNISNVTQAYNALQKVLEKIIPKDQYKTSGLPYFEGAEPADPFTKIGDLHVYDDGQNMQYTPA